MHVVNRFYTLIAWYSMELRAVFKANLKKYRKANCFSQMKLAELCNTSTNYIGEIETGKKSPSVEMIQRIASALDVAPYKLFMTEEDLNKVDVPPEIKNALIENLQKTVAEIVEHDLSMCED